jgi:hypothetical protein
MNRKSAKAKLLLSHFDDSANVTGVDVVDWNATSGNITHRTIPSPVSDLSADIQGPNFFISVKKFSNNSINPLNFFVVFW